MHNRLALVVSFLSGVALTIIIALSVGASAPQTQAPVGRFKMKMTENHVYVLDTATGMVWETFIVSGSGESDNDFKANKLAPAK